jgi:hypothetical protein
MMVGPLVLRRRRSRLRIPSDVRVDDRPSKAVYNLEVTHYKLSTLLVVNKRFPPLEILVIVVLLVYSKNV